MLQDIYDLINFGGIDVIQSQGVSIPGLYSQLDSAYQRTCKLAAIFNWKFNGVLIPPSVVTLTKDGDSILINNLISVDNTNVIRIYSISRDPVIESVSFTENGVYTAPGGVDGYSPVEVNVNPVLSPLSVTSNGIYTPEPGVDGFNRVSVSITNPYPYVVPAFEGLSYTYIALNGDSYQSKDLVYYSGICEVTPGTYALFLGVPNSNRYRSHFYADKTFSDFEEYVENPYEGSGDTVKLYTCTQNITGSNEYSDYSNRFIITVESSGVIFTVTSNTGSTACKPYLFKLS